MGDPLVLVNKPRGCGVEGCESKHNAKGYCLKHYQRFKQYGDPLFMKIAERGTGYVPKDSGYRMICINGRKIKEHRYVMSQMLGRPLLPHENPHHKNGDKLDNRPDNLELWSVSQPPGQRVIDKVEWATELLRLYAPERLV